MSTEEEASAAIEAAWEEGYKAGQDGIMIGWKWTPIDGAQRYKILLAVTDNLDADFVKILAEHIAEKVLAKDDQNLASQD